MKIEIRTIVSSETRERKDWRFQLKQIRDRRWKGKFVDKCGKWKADTEPIKFKQGENMKKMVELTRISRQSKQE